MIYIASVRMFDRYDRTGVMRACLCKSPAAAGVGGGKGVQNGAVESNAA
jgi:hypothetical protein